MITITLLWHWKKITNIFLLSLSLSISLSKDKEYDSDYADKHSTKNASIKKTQDHSSSKITVLSLPDKLSTDANILYIKNMIFHKKWIMLIIP